MNDEENIDDSFIETDIRQKVVVGFSAGGTIEDWSNDFDDETPTESVPKLSIKTGGSFLRLSEDIDTNMRSPVPSPLFDSFSPRMRRLQASPPPAMAIADSDDGDSEIEDWDEEFGLTNTAQSNLNEFQNIVTDLFKDSSSNDPNLDTIVPKLCRLIQRARTKSSLKIVRYPKPSGMYTLRSDDGFPCLGEKQMELWLAQIVVRKCAPYLAALPMKDEEVFECLSPTSQREIIGQLSPSKFRFSVEEESEMEPVTLDTIVPGFPVMSEQYLDQLVHQVWLKQKSSKPSTRHMLPDIIKQIFGELKAADDVPVKPFLDLIQLYSLVWWDLETDSTVSELVQKLYTVFPTCALTIALTELRCVAHYGKQLSSQAELYQWSSCLPTNRVYSAQVILNRYFELYLLASQGNNLLIQAQVLNDLYLSSLELSPLTGASGHDWLESEEEEEYELDHTPEATVSYPDEIEYEQFVLDKFYRMDLLCQLYPKIPTDEAEIKAISALALGHYTLITLQDSFASETILMESIQLIDRSKGKYSEANHFFLMPLGTFALELFGDTLVANNKYRYGILAYEAAITSYKVREKAEYERMNRRLCNICLKHGDSIRAFPFHLKILQSAKKDKNLNEFVYISEVVGKMLLDQGKFSSAEDYLIVALSFLREQVAGLPPLYDGLTHTQTTTSLSDERNSNDHIAIVKRGHRRVSSGDLEGSLMHYVTLHVQICRVYVANGKYQEACNILRFLLSHRLPPGQRTDLQMLYAEHLLKQRQLHESYAVLLQLGREATECLASPVGAADISTSPLRLPRSGSYRGSVFMSDRKRTLAMVQSTRYLKCRARCHFYAHDVATALHWICVAIASCDRSNRSEAAALYMLKGRICADVRNDISFDYEAAIIDDRYDQWVTLTLDQQQIYEIERRSVESLAAFSQAYDYYCTIDDVLHQIKVLLRMIRLTLEPESSSIEQAEIALPLVLEYVGDLSDPFLMLQALSLQAEFHLTCSAPKSSYEVWKEAVDILRTLYFQLVESPEERCFLAPVVAFAPGMILKLHQELEHLIEMMFHYDSKHIEEHEDLLTAWIFLDEKRRDIENITLWPRYFYGRPHCHQVILPSPRRKSPISKGKHRKSMSVGSNFVGAHSMGDVLTNWFGPTLSDAERMTHSTEDVTRSRGASSSSTASALSVESEQQESTPIRRRATSEPHAYKKGKDQSHQIPPPPPATVEPHTRKMVSPVPVGGRNSVAKGFLFPDQTSWIRFMSKLRIERPCIEKDSYYAIDSTRRAKIWNVFHQLRQLRDQYVSGQVVQREYADENVELVAELLKLRFSKPFMDPYAASSAILPLSKRFIPSRYDSRGGTVEEKERQKSIESFVYTLPFIRYQSCSPPILQSESVWVSTDPPTGREAGVQHLFARFSARLVLKLISACLLETPVIVIGKSKTVIASIVEGLLLLLRPFQWTQLCIPYLPAASKDLFLSMIEKKTIGMIGLSSGTYDDCRYDLSLRTSNVSFNEPTVHQTLGSVTSHLCIVDLNTREIIFPTKAPVVRFPEKLRKKVVESKTWLTRLTMSSGSKQRLHTEESVLRFEQQLLSLYATLIQDLTKWGHDPSLTGISKSMQPFLRQLARTNTWKMYQQDSNAFTTYFQSEYLTVE